ncbi:hypothetical protein SARC_05387 [Sphaeroforma arctica JP610]|uniref:Uncharacterized protein n=1 Tax=Sphaeroforma arctica JP610 TaxID=667725 RepID=A0A0L0G2A3_9EUKA|nr:hypothetical protein SARC_05387 [Sphaeroforma arctica JP610]KNC82323.1 hypothetical protein SARC_05387 [Sphaeroforma arctica JP610]|eukprot:XP_014156225.1 hypothetical protein SARC_05387 [Sphaeroforma arctica JP610]
MTFINGVLDVAPRIAQTLVETCWTIWRRNIALINNIIPNEVILQRTLTVQQQRNGQITTPSDVDFTDRDQRNPEPLRGTRSASQTAHQFVQEAMGDSLMARRMLGRTPSNQVMSASGDMSDDLEAEHRTNNAILQQTLTVQQQGDERITTPSDVDFTDRDQRNPKPLEAHVRHRRLHIK